MHASRANPSPAQPAATLFPSFITINYRPQKPPQLKSPLVFWKGLSLNLPKTKQDCFRVNDLTLVILTPKTRFFKFTVRFIEQQWFESFPRWPFLTTREPFSLQCFRCSQGDGRRGGRVRRPSCGGAGTRIVQGVSPSSSLNLYYYLNIIYVDVHPIFVKGTKQCFDNENNEFLTFSYLSFHCSSSPFVSRIIDKMLSSIIK